MAPSGLRRVWRGRSPRPSSDCTTAPRAIFRRRRATLNSAADRIAMTPNLTFEDPRMEVLVAASARLGLGAASEVRVEELLTGSRWRFVLFKAGPDRSEIGVQHSREAGGVVRAVGRPLHRSGPS